MNSIHSATATPVSPPTAGTSQTPAGWPTTPAAALPMPLPLGNVAIELAALVLEEGHSRAKTARASEANLERSARVAEDRIVDEMRARAASTREHALLAGAFTAAGGLASVGSAVTSAVAMRNGAATTGAGASAAEASGSTAKASVLPFVAKGLEATGKGLGDTSHVVRSLAEAVQTDHDATTERERNTARRALRASESWQKDSVSAGELIERALAFAREHEKARSETLLAIGRRA